MRAPVIPFGGRFYLDLFEGMTNTLAPLKKNFQISQFMRIVLLVGTFFVQFVLR